MMDLFRQKLKKKEKIIGSIASILAIVMFVSLIEVFISNIQGKSQIFVQPIATAFNGFFWSLYACSKRDNYLLIPNLLALFLGVLTALSAIL